nr:DUF29 domain-containing protein [uncultured Rhodopila sp.]
MSDYDADVLAWSEHQAGLLRRRAAGELINEAELDWPNIAEEIEALGKNLDRELASRISAILLHLMKLQTSPAIDPRAGWRDTVQEQRDEVERLLSFAPSRRSRVTAVIAEETGRARRRARMALADHDEQPASDLDAISYTEDQVLGPWLP